MMTDILKLIAEEKTVDRYGDTVVTESSRQVFCREESVGQKEFYQAAAVGLTPEIKLVLSDYLDYQNEKLVLYNGDRYRVLRTYRKGQELELILYSEVNPS